MLGSFFDDLLLCFSTFVIHYSFSCLDLISDIRIALGFLMSDIVYSLGASLPLKTRQTSLDLGDLQQVLQDEELAHKLQEQENKLLARVWDYSS